MYLTLSYTGPLATMHADKIGEIDEPYVPNLSSDEAPALAVSTLWANAVAAGAVQIPEILEVTVYGSDEDGDAMFKVGVNSKKVGVALELCGPWFDVDNLFIADDEHEPTGEDPGPNTVESVLSNLLDFVNGLLTDAGGEEGAADNAGDEMMLVDFEAIKDSIALAMKSTGVSAARITEVVDTVHDFAVNNFGDDS